MRVVVIGGTGHVGTFLIPRLVEAGHQVICVCRQQRQPYQPHRAWQTVELVSLDRSQLDEQDRFGQAIADLSPQVVIDLICFQLNSAHQLVSALQDRLEHYLHCGTMWVHGHSVVVPTDESQPRHPFGEYGIQKAAIEDFLLRKVDQRRFPATILHPGHLVGPGWLPINPAGNLNPVVFDQLAQGQEVLLPDRGMETLHHVHVDDVALGFMQALTHRAQAVGESFHILSANALTMRGYAEAMAAWYGQLARLRFVPWEEFCQHVSTQDASLTWDHLAHSPHGSIEKARRLLAYNPRYSSLEAIQQALSWLKKQPNPDQE
ncbi:NAD-dependent epimerase/dehydratase family protein [Spirosoma endbachense]|uniref:NAD-dependent epimerase/dehydratase family protein n=1 Tax=Spirosoma endbachense TaxID=2666025 RepID=A0A6P1VWC9_9BACT|nr:NAD-dependent epimerase/dehydratase family protein [Spirosoma endbachense]QHV96678.1 NAD-dependent epimerase/dehydratase family protein [Spirosoma endbachense]